MRAPSRRIVSPGASAANGWRCDRRKLLSCLAGTTALAPFLPLLSARAQEERPLRLVLWFTPHGTIRDRWRPSGGEKDFQLGPILSSLERHRDRLMVIDGLKLVDAGPAPPHTKGAPLLWTASPLLENATFSTGSDADFHQFGWNTAPSVDQFILNRSEIQTPYRSLEFGVRCAGSFPGSRTIYSGTEAPLSPETNPWEAFERLIGSGGLEAQEQDKAHAEQKSVLDLVSAEIAEVRSKVGSEDRRKMDAHLEAVRAMESRLDFDAGICSPLGLGDKIDAEAPDSTPVVYDRSIDMLTTALSCDLTRFASMQFRIGDNDGGYNYNWLGITDEEHHLLSHTGDEDTSSQDALATIYSWYAERFAYFLDQLEAVEDVDGRSLLDNTLVVWGSEIGKGNTHSFENIPFVLAGGAAGRLEMGRFLSFEGVEHNRLLTSICQVMGLSDVEQFGSTDPGRGGLPGLS